MWCRHCEAEVAGIVSSGDDRQLICARCQHQVEDLSAKTFSDSSENLPGGPLGLRLDMSHLRENLRAADRLLESLTLEDLPPEQPRGAEERLKVRQIKRSQAAANEDGAHADQPPSLALSYDDLPQLPAPNWWVGGVLGVGSVTLCGGALLSITSLIRDLPLAWNLGLPALLLGQAGVIVGLVLYADSLVTQEQELTEQLTKLRQAKPGLRRRGLELLSVRRTSRRSSLLVNHDL
ncbi:MAG: hypothetical protein WD045_08540 [Pirellulaceae bacterium]